MRMFIIKKAYEREEFLRKFLQKNNVSVKECKSVREALAEAQSVTEDKISVIIVNTVEEKVDKEHEKRLRIQTFGNFEVFCDGKPMDFTRAKSKELLAYLIDRRGAAVTTAEACGILWEDKEYDFSRQRQFQTIVSDLLKSLRIHHFEHLVHRRRNCLSVDVSELECDYYRLLEGDATAKECYNGEYMSNYSWAEMTAGFLAQKYGNKEMGRNG